MATSQEDSWRRQEIQSSLNSIVETSEKWLGRLKKRQFRVRLATAFLTTFLAFGAIGIILLVYLFFQGALWTLINNPTVSAIIPVVGRVIATAGIGGLACGFAVYFVMRHRHTSELKELSSLTKQMRKTQGGNKAQSEEGEAIAGNALSLADKLFDLLPAVIRKRNQDPVVFGIAAFFLTLIFAGSSGSGGAIAILVGVIVWIYFRYETKKTYGEEMAKFEEQKRIFEQRKKDFLETL
jgi:hypothetical protein